MEDGDGPDSPAGSDTNAVGLHDVSQTLISNRFLMIVCVYFSSYFFFFVLSIQVDCPLDGRPARSFELVRDDGQPTSDVRRVAR